MAHPSSVSAPVQASGNGVVILPYARPKAPPELVIEFTDRGVDDEQLPAYFSEKITNALVIRASQEQFPEHVQVQFRQRYKIIRDVIHHFIERAVNSSRFNTEIDLRLRGFTDAADYLRSERIKR